MPCHFEFESANRILRCRLDGPVSDDSFRECYRVLGKYAAFTSPSGGILDMSAVTSFAVSPETVRELAALRPAFPDMNAPRVVVAPSTQVFGLARLFELAGQDTRPNLHIVRTLREAYAILGIQAPNWQPLTDEP